MMLNLMYTDEYVANTLIWGIENVHYVVLDDGRVDFPEGLDTQSSGYNPAVGWVMGNQFLSRPWVTDDIDIWEQTRIFNESARLSPATGYTFDASNVAIEVAACQAVLDEYNRPIMSGSVDLSKIEEMNNKLYAAGLQSVIDEKQSQYDAWRANR